MSTSYYFLEANAYLIVFYAFYKILLQRETFYSLNRFYLLTSTGISFLLPFLDVSAVRGAISEQIYTNAAVAVPAESNGIEWWEIALRIYLLVVFGLLLRLASQLYGISKLVKSGSMITHGNFKEVQIRAENLSFSFFNYLFINPELEEQNTIRKHELVHISQKHSLDILFIELVQIINWFNPLIYLIKTDIKAIHEFIADEIVSRDELGKQDYAMFLIKNSYGHLPQNLSNQMFNQSLLKKRIMKLIQKKSGDTARLKYGLLALLIPLMLGVSAFSISKTYGIIDLMPAETAYQDTIKKGIKSKPASPSKVSPAKKNPAETPPKPMVKNVKFPPPVVMPRKKEPKADKELAGSEIKEVIINEPVVEEVRIEEKIKEVKILELPQPQQSEMAPPPPPPARPISPKSSVTIRSNRKSIAPPPPPVMNKRLNRKDIPPPPPPVEPKSKSIQGDPVKKEGKTETIQGDPISE